MKGSDNPENKVSFEERIDRAISGGIKGQLTLLVKAVICVLAFFSILAILVNCDFGVREPLDGRGKWLDQMWVVYTSFVDSGVQAEQSGFGNRLFSIIVSLFGSVLLGGVLISTISNIIERRVEKVRNGKVHYKTISGHYVIIGYTRVTVSLIRELYREDPLAKIIVMSSQSSETVRHNLQAGLDKEVEGNVLIYFGNIESKEELQRLNIDRAKEVYILGEEGDYGRDSKNIHCVLAVSAIKGNIGDGPQLNVYTQFERMSSYSVIQKFNIMSGSVGADGEIIDTGNIYFRPFNLYENWARRLWSIYSLEEDVPYDTLDYEPVTVGSCCNSVDGGKYVHLVIAGFSGMGQALMLEALRVCHYPYYNDNVPEENRIRTRITLIDTNIQSLREHFEAQYPNLKEQVDDIEIHYEEGDICSEKYRNRLKEWANDGKQLLTVAICVSDPDESIALGLSLPAEVYQSRTRVLVRQEIQTDLGAIIHKDNGRYCNVKVFGMLEKGISRSMLMDDLASYANEEYNSKGFIFRLYESIINGENKKIEELKAQARNSWIGLEENMRWANRYQIDAYVTFANALGYKFALRVDEGYEEVKVDEFVDALTDKVLLPLMAMEKYRWNAERTIEGWRYGAQRDNVHRVHQLIVPFKDIPVKEKLKDKAVIVNLPYMAVLGGYKIVKLKKS